MKSNYKKLSEFIHTVNKRNKGLVTEDLRGLSMNKVFRKSTSNIVGTDLSKYKLVYKNQFACDFMSVIRVHKLPVVLHLEDKPVIISPAYIVFEIIDTTILSPEYLMMWFRRSEFDRYADFRCDSAIRGGFKWDELCEVELPIPTIKKQTEIVKEYNTVVNRIKLNEQLNKKLEETAQALYKHWFVDFEFPDAEGKPFKSNGGKMVFNVELDKEIPEGWKNSTLGSIADVKTGPFGSALLNEQYVVGGTPVITVEHIKKFRIANLNYPSVSEEDRDRLSAYSLEEGDIVFSRVGSVDLNALVRFKNSGWLFSSRMLRVRPNRSIIDPILLSLFLRLPSTRNHIISISVGSTMPSINTVILKSIPVQYGPSSVNEKLRFCFRVFDERVANYDRQNQTLTKMKELLLSKMSKVELEMEY